MIKMRLTSSLLKYGLGFRSYAVVLQGEGLPVKFTNLGPKALKFQLHG